VNYRLVNMRLSPTILTAVWRALTPKVAILFEPSPRSISSQGRTRRPGRSSAVRARLRDGDRSRSDNNLETPSTSARSTSSSQASRSGSSPRRQAHIGSSLAEPGRLSQWDARQNSQSPDPRHRQGIQGNVFAAPAGKNTARCLTLQDYFSCSRHHCNSIPGPPAILQCRLLVLGLLIERFQRELLRYVRLHTTSLPG